MHSAQSVWDWLSVPQWRLLVFRLPLWQSTLDKRGPWYPSSASLPELRKLVPILYKCQTKAGNQLLFSCLCSKVTLSLSHSLTLTLSLFHSLIHSLSTWWTTFVFMSMVKSHFHILSLSLFLTLTLFQSLIHSLWTCWTTFVFISMLKSRCL